MRDAMVRADVSASGAYAGDHPHLSESLNAEGLLALLAYEEAHGNRSAIVQALTERLAAVRSGIEPRGPLGAGLPAAPVE
ncbi:hypothetical protein [Mycetocola sp. 2940]|uniref:hypothetical protein n=1 Tax=Mycetocola sp. 2940 TaxID=3156452 RepID=UPI003390B18B